MRERERPFWLRPRLPACLPGKRVRRREKVRPDLGGGDLSPRKQLILPATFQEKKKNKKEEEEEK